MENRRVDPDKGPPTIVIIGGRGTGKTYLVRDIMYYFRRIPAGMIITGSEASSEAFSEFFPKSLIKSE
jgi:chromosomal replication initiation ATPase DnaA